MIDMRNIRKDYAGTQVLDGLDLRIARGDKVGLIGRNGAGKTTLIRILTGEDEDYSGAVSREEGATVAHVPQAFPEFAGTALDYVLEPVKAIRVGLAGLEEEMGAAEGKRLDAVLARYGALRADYDRAGGDDAEDRARRLLEGLALGRCADAPAMSLSGGERNVLALARAALPRPDLLVLDEPGNHLDYWGLAWLEGFIRDYPGEVLVVSHNRYLLDRAVSRIVELDAGKATGFAGNYSAWRVDRLRRSVAGDMARKADQKKLERLEETVRRFAEIARAHPDPAWGRRLRARRTQLEKSREWAAGRDAARPASDGPSLSVSFAGEASRADVALKLDGFACARGGRVLLEETSLLVEPGERVALVGPNGCGKTSFLEDVLRESAEGSSRAFIGPSMRVAYCSQHGETVDPEGSVLAACLRAGARDANAAWAAVSRFLFTRDALDQRAGSLSGGERNRLQLALATIAGANFLVLDEPTNHLDIPAREAVEDALAEFAGTALIVSHDRYLLDRVATRILEIDGGELVEYRGNFSEFWFRRYGSAIAAPIAASSVGTRARAIARAKEPRPSADETERRILALEAERPRLEKELVAARERGDLRRARDLGGRLADLSLRIERLYEEWG